VSSERRATLTRIAGRWTLLAAIGSSGALGLAACLGSVDRVYPDGGGGETGPAMGDDATVDSPAEAPAMPGMDGGVAQDGDAMVVDAMAPADTSPSPPDAPVDDGTTGQTFSCNGQTVTSCATCMGKPVECVFCAQDGGHPGVCGTGNSYCSGSAPSGSGTCTCPGGVAQCPEPFQVCNFIAGQNYCQSCGEMYTTTAACKGGGHCSTNGTCQ
jgi:hypothetical protein